jgi:hypothetical protein
MLNRCFSLLVFSTSIIYASVEKYSISVCTTSTLEYAQICKKRILTNSTADVFIVKTEDNKYVTYLGVYDDKKQARYTIKTSSSYVKQQNPFVKILSEDIVTIKGKNEIYIDLKNKPEEIKSKERIRVIIPLLKIDKTEN